MVSSAEETALKQILPIPRARLAERKAKSWFESLLNWEKSKWLIYIQSEINALKHFAFNDIQGKEEEGEGGDGPEVAMLLSKPWPHPAELSSQFHPPAAPCLPPRSPGPCFVKTFRSRDNEESGEKKKNNIGFYEKLLPKCKKAKQSRKTHKTPNSLPAWEMLLFVIYSQWVGRERGILGWPDGQGQRPSRPSSWHRAGSQHLGRSRDKTPQVPLVARTTLSSLGPGLKAHHQASSPAAKPY